MAIRINNWEGAHIVAVTPASSASMLVPGD